MRFAIHTLRIHSESDKSYQIHFSSNLSSSLIYLYLQATVSNPNTHTLKLNFGEANYSPNESDFLGVIDLSGKAQVGSLIVKNDRNELLATKFVNFWNSKGF